jgi:hypothetical protein
MLTEAKEVLRSTARILAAIAELRKLWEDTVKSILQARTDTDAVRQHGDQLDETINVAMKELVSYCLLNLGVSGSTDVKTHILNNLN